MEQLTPEKIAQIKDLLKDMDFSPTNQSLIKDNKLIFIHNGVTYRCKMPNQKIQNEAENQQNKTRVVMYNQEGTITRNKLIKVLKEKQDIDIDAFEKERNRLRDELQEVYLDIAITMTDEKEKLAELELKKNEIESKFMTVTIELTEWLSPCIEEQSKQAFYGYLAYACIEKNVGKEEEKWEPVWKSYEEYQNDDTGLAFVALQKIQSLILHLSE